MKLSFVLLLGLFPLITAFAAPDLRVGDILLQPLDCWSCDLIEAEEKTIYSHMAIILKAEPLTVAESSGTVRALPLENFLQKTQAGQKVAVLRFKDSMTSRWMQRAKEHFFEVFEAKYQGKKYDHDFRWDNLDENGNEKFYCSEFISKLLLDAFEIETPIKRMHFIENRELWHRYFRGNIPDGLWGNSPADFEKSHLFEKVGEL